MKKVKINLLGQVFNRLKVIGDAGTDKHKHSCWLCRCDCGNETIVKGIHLRSGHTQSCGCKRFDALSKRTGQNHPMWRGGRHLDKNGYISIYTGRGKRELEHRLIMEKHLGRSLRKNEIVHHMDGNPSNNKLDNLLAMDIDEHNRLHKCHEYT